MAKQSACMVLVGLMTVVGIATATAFATGRREVASRAHTSVSERSVSQWAADLKASKDFRVRTQAALSLGASASAQAVGSLCAALSDASVSVRAAAAAALGKLRKGGEKCLSARLSREASAPVKQAVVKALADVAAAQPKPLTEQTRYYLAVGTTTDETGRKAGEVDVLVRRAIEEAIHELPGYALAPAEEDTTAASAILHKHRQLSGYFLWPKVLAPEYAAGKLVVRVELAIFSYPKKALRGSLPVKLSMPDVRTRDVASENQLISMASSRAIVKFSESIDRL